MERSRVTVEGADSSDIWGAVELDGMWHLFMLSLETGHISMGPTREAETLIRHALAQQISATRDKN